MLLELSQLIIVRSKCQQRRISAMPDEAFGYYNTVSQKRPGLHLSNCAAYYANAHVKVVESA